MLAQSRKEAARRALVGRRLGICLLMVLTPTFGVVSVVDADLITLTPVADNTLYEDPSGSVSNGAGSAMFAGRNSAVSNSIRRALLTFDVAGAIPADSTIDSATLTLTHDAANVSPQLVSLHRLTQSWGEGTSAAGGGQGSGGPAAPGDATWLHRHFNTELWAAPGGDFLATVSSTAIVSGPGSYLWPSTDVFVANVQDFLDQPADNFGWLLLGNEAEASSAKRFATREALDPSTRPRLRIEFTPVPEPSSILMLSTLLLFARAGGRHGIERRTRSWRGKLHNRFQLPES